MPDKAIDLIDEAGSWVRLCHAQFSEEARELEKELKQIAIENNEAVRSQDFEKAGELCDRRMELKAQISTLIDKGKEMIKAETEAGDIGLVVTEVNIQHIVSSWTGQIDSQFSLQTVPSNGHQVEDKWTMEKQNSSIEKGIQYTLFWDSLQKIC